MESMIVEQTRRYKKRVAYDPATNTFHETAYGCLFHERGFAYPYGWLKRTGTPPGDHLDIFLMSDDDLALGDEVPVRVIGVFLRNDRDHKLVGVPPSRPEEDFAQLPECERSALRGVYPKVREGEGWHGAAVAQDIIAEFMRNKNG